MSNQSKDDSTPETPVAASDPVIEATGEVVDMRPPQTEFEMRGTGLEAQMAKGPTNEQMASIVTAMHHRVLKGVAPKVREQLTAALAQVSPSGAPNDLRDLVVVVFDDKEPLFHENGPPEHPLNVQICLRSGFAQGLAANLEKLTRDQPEYEKYKHIAPALARSPLRGGFVWAVVFAMGTATLTEIGWTKRPVAPAPAPAPT